MSLLEHSWMREIINLQAKNVFIFPCNYFGKDFKQNYINYLKSKFLNKIALKNRIKWSTYALL